MRGSSSELLLEASCSQCQSEHDRNQGRDSGGEYDFHERELRRKRKLLELGLGASRRRPPRPTCRQRFNFYATSALAFVATSGGAALLFLVPLYVDPAISTLAADFSPEPVICTTSRREDLAGLFNCTWSSCREGCTSDVYSCTHIYVTYTPWSNASMKNDTGGRNTTANATADLGTVTAVSTPGDVEAVLLVNIKGCGYPPAVDCKNFTRELGYEGAKFPCHYSRVNGSIVMANYNREAQVAIIMHFFAAPFVVTLATSVVLCVMHCDCRCTPPPRHPPRGMRRSRGNDLSDHSISNRVDRRGHPTHCECGEVTRPL
ncbi:tipE homolog 1 isoform X1 [Temnothorax longispinosus]|uniref:tipE homolog 1 isoform X1 n=1 Tax=Temnothorax longispinosus TaxID=300112 RepID=UPI003A99639E